MKIRVKKLEAAESQLIEAIRLFFEERDPVSIHTLVSAASQILHDHFTKEEAEKYEILFHYYSPLIPEKLRKSTRDGLKAAANFFKHADTDITSEIEFDSQDSESDMAEAIRCVRLLKGWEYIESIPEYFALDTWFLVKAQQSNLKITLKNEDLILGLETFKNYTKADYLKLIENLKSNPKFRGQK